MSYCATKVKLVSSTLADYQTSKIVARQHSNSMNEIDISNQSDTNLYQISSNILCFNLLTVYPTVEYTLSHWIDNYRFVINKGLNIEYSDPMKSDVITINVVDVINSSFCVATEDARKLYNNIYQNIIEKKKVVASFKNIKLLTPLFLNMSICQLYGQFDEDIINNYVDIVDIDEEDKKMLSIQVKKAKRYFKNPELFKKIINTSFGELNE